MKPFTVCLTTDGVKYLQFAQIASAAWKKFFPECEVHLSILTDRSARDKSFVYLYKYIDMITVYKPLDDYEIDVQVKALSLWAITQHFFDDKLCVLANIDKIPLQKKYVEDLINLHEGGDSIALGEYKVFNSKTLVKNYDPEICSLDSICHIIKSTPANANVFLMDHKDSAIPSNAIIDRASWRIITGKLKAGEYVYALLPRNRAVNDAAMLPLIDYIGI